MSRCQNCNKFSALEFQEPELESFDVALELDPESGDLEVVATASVRLVRTSECCGDEMKTADLELEEQLVISRVEIADHLDEVDGVWSWKAGHEATSDNDDPEQLEEGGGRYAKSYFGAQVSYRVTCNGKNVHEGCMADKVAASSMDEC